MIRPSHTGRIQEWKGAQSCQWHFRAQTGVVLSGARSSFYGAIVGKTVDFNGGFEIHIDESLPILTANPAPPPMLVR